MVLSARQEIAYKNGILNDYGVKASVTIYTGALVAVDSTGYLIPCPANVGAGNTFVGIANEGTVEDSAVDGYRHVGVLSDGEYLFPVTSAAITSIGAPVYVSTDGLLVMTRPADGIAVGTIVNYTGETNKAWVKFVEKKVDTSSQAFKVSVPFAHTEGGATTEVDTGVSIPARAQIENVAVEVITAVAASTIDVGIKDVDSDGLVDGMSCADAGFIAFLNGQDADSKNTRGLLIATAGAKSGDASALYWRIPTHYVVAAAKNVVYTPADKTFAGKIHITYRLV